MSRARLSSKGRLTLPAEVRRRLGLQPGDWLVFSPTSRGVEARKVSDSVGDLYGSLPPLKMPWKEARELAWRKRAQRIVFPSDS